MAILEHVTDSPRQRGRIPQVEQLQFDLPKVNLRFGNASLAAFLFRYTGQDEISFGVASAEGGSFQFRRLALQENETFAGLASRIEECEVETGDAQILISGGNTTPPLPPHFEVAFHLSVSTLTLYYDAHLYRRETIERWSSYFLSLLAAATKNPAASFAEIELLSESERQLMLETWNAHSPEAESFYSDEPSKDYCLHRIFEKQVERTPDRPAAESHGRVWTYRELNEHANRIAHFLLADEVKPDERIGIYLDRSAEMLAALFGIMKAGGAYVPLDTALPRERLEYMASDSGARLILTSSDLFEEAPVPEGAKAVVLGGEEFQTFIDQNPDGITNPETEVDSSNLIYVIYTSGSTGMPKGVMLGHNSVVNYLWSIIEANELTDRDTWFSYTTTAFDPSVKELFSLLFIGGKVVVGPKGAGADGETLARLIRESQATRIFATPTTLRILIASGWEGDQKLDILSGGEAISRELANELVPLCRVLYNVYGPTEATIFNTNKILTVSDEPVTIGKVLAGCRMYIVDDSGKLCPPQVRGNLFIGGVCLAHGYWNKPELTAEKFIADPFSEKPGAKMYDTGDVAYWTPDGEIVFLGRSDHQVKIRGYRIELGEIEKVLEDHPGVQDSVVMVREDTPGQPRIVAYGIPENESLPEEEELRDFMSGPLPAYMIPGWFVEIDEFPLTPSRKTDRNALPKPEDVDPPANTETCVEDQGLAGEIAKIWAGILGRRSIRVSDEVYAIGADSLNSVQFQARLEEALGLRLPIAEIFQSRTPEALATRIQEIRGETSSQIRTFSREQETGSRDIAIIGMSGRFPGAGNLDEFWENLINEVESIEDLSEEELESWGVPRREYLREGYVSRSGNLKGAYDFDNEFFNLSPKDAEILSPQIRLFLKTTWETMEDAGYPEEPENSRIGIFAGSGYPNYLFGHEEISDTERVHLISSNGMDYLATRASYLFGLTGPSLAIQTACSTSLVAINEACEALLAGRCEMALAGASSFSWPHERGHLHERGMIYSSDGTNRSFDAAASGTIFTQGVGTVMLKPLSSALADGDNIHAVIRGVAVNNDGNRKNGYASPSIEGQAEVIAQAMANAGVSPEEISYVEAHATGTAIGDPIEVAGLTRAWRGATEQKQFCALGSVKANIGHTDAAAGIAGLFKLILALKNRTIPATVHLKEPNPELQIEDSPFFLVDQTLPWNRRLEDQPLIGAVSSFGIGGTNAHMIVEEAPGVPEKRNQSGPRLQLFPFSAESSISLESQLARWPSFLEDQPELNINDVAFTLQTGRKTFRHRTFTVTDSLSGLQESLSANEIHFSPTKQSGASRRPVFLFTGQGSQYLNMARSSYEQDPVFRKALDRCAGIIDQHWEHSLLDLLFAEETEANRQLLLQTSIAQPALFAVSYAQAMRWMDAGVTPSALAGHSIGEYVAATISGVMQLEDALQLVVLRGKLMQSMEPGRMLAVILPHSEVSDLLKDEPDLDLAASNSPSFTVVSGDSSSIDTFSRRLIDSGVACKILHTSHAFHSRSMEPMLKEFAEAVASLTLSAPSIPFPSNVSGTWITDEEATSPSYYAKQIRATVRFSDCISSITERFEEENAHALFLEMGPGSALTTFASEVISGTDHLSITTLPGAREETESHRFTLEAMGKYWASGQFLDWNRFHRGRAPKRVSLPTYHYNENRFRSPDQNIKGCRTSSDPTENSLLHVPVWKQTYLSDSSETTPSVSNTPPVWICFSRGWAQSSFEKKLLRDGAKVIRITVGKEFRRRNGSFFSIRPGVQEDYENALDHILTEHGAIHGILHHWTSGSSSTKDEASFWKAHDKGAIGLLWLARALGGRLTNCPVNFNVITGGLIGNQLSPENHALSSAASVIQREYPGLITKVIDLSRFEKSDLSAVRNLISKSEHHPLIARRDSEWWRPVYEPIHETAETEPLRKIRDGATYIFSGGLGGLSLSIAKRLADEADNLDIVLINRSELPPHDLWDEVDSELDRKRIAEIREIISLGATVHLHQADLSKKKELVETLNKVRESHGDSIRGIFHTAGVNRDSIIAMKTDEGLRDVFAAKALSALHLLEYTGKHFKQLDFLALFSSVSSELGYFGGSDYAAANAYLDGLAAKAKREGIPAIAINWAIWRQTGMGSKVDQSVGEASGIGNDLLIHSLSPDQGAAAMLKVLARSPGARIAVFPGNFEKRRQSALDQRRSASLPQSDGHLSKPKSTITLEESPTDIMLALWQDCLKDSELTCEDHYFEKGGDSLAAIRLISGIERSFGQSIPMSYLISSPTVSSLVEKMGLTTSTSVSADDSPLTDTPAFPSHILPLSDDNPAASGRRNMFCVHGADGSVLFYKPFADKLQADVSIHAIEAPMLRDPLRTPPESLTQVARQYFDDIRAVQPRGPYLFSGYSYGALVAWEMARLALEDGEEVAGVVVFDMFNPAKVRKFALRERLGVIWENADNNDAGLKRLGRFALRLGQLGAWMIRHAADKFQLRAGSGTKEMRSHVKARDLHEEQLRTYIPTALDISVALIRTIDPGDKYDFGEMLGWKGIFREDVRISRVTGNHLEIFQAQHLNALTEATDRFLRELDEKTEPQPSPSDKYRKSRETRIPSPHQSSATF